MITTVTTLTPGQIAAATGARIDRAAARADGLNEAMRLYGIADTPRRMRYFLANIGHETASLRYRTEIWGPTETQRRYERDFSKPWPTSVAQSRLPGFGANRKAFVLGNSQPGDGRRYAGHGDLQITGRFNHAAARDRLRKRFPELDVPDFEAEPERLTDSLWAALAAGDYIDNRDLNAYADAGDFDGYCDEINLGRKTDIEGDSNGWEHRMQLLAAAEHAIPD